MSSRQKKSYFNTPATSKKGIIMQHTQRNPYVNASLTELRRSKIQTKQSIISNKRHVPSFVELPSVVKNLPGKIFKTIQSTHNQDTYHTKKGSSTGITYNALPKLCTPNASSIYNHIIKHNLTQRVILRCKSPPPPSLLSRSTTFIGLERQEPQKTYHPLQRMDVGLLLTESARYRLKRLFNRLDKDQDGLKILLYDICKSTAADRLSFNEHLSYPEVQRCLPTIFSRAQLTFFRVLYDVISCQTYFGLQEFYATAIVVEIIAKQDPHLWNKLLDDVDFNYYHNSIFELLEDFNNQSTTDLGTISYDQLVEFIKKRTGNSEVDQIVHELESIIPKIKTMKMNRLDFIALVPTIIYIESNLKHGRSLFRFQENSLLDSHIRQALITS